MTLVDGLPPYKFGPWLLEWREQHHIDIHHLADVWGIHVDQLRDIERRRVPPPTFAAANYEALAAYVALRDNSMDVHARSRHLDEMRDADRKTWSELPSDFWDRLRLKSDGATRR